MLSRSAPNSCVSHNARPRPSCFPKLTRRTGTAPPAAARACATKGGGHDRRHHCLGRRLRGVALPQIAPAQLHLHLSQSYSSWCQRCAYTCASSMAGAFFGTGKPVHSRSSSVPRPARPTRNRISSTRNHRRARRLLFGSHTATSGRVPPRPPRHHARLQVLAHPNQIVTAPRRYSASAPAPPRNRGVGPPAAAPLWATARAAPGRAPIPTRRAERAPARAGGAG